jgi:uncharacterized protein (DUF1501 family)
MISRRDFLNMLATSGAALPLVPGLGASCAARVFAHTIAQPFAGTALLHESGDVANDRVLVIVRLFGGNDGLNTVVPYHDANYYNARRDANYDISISAERVLKLSNSSTIGFHPAMKRLHELYAEEKVLVVQNVGYPEQDLSHFRSNDIWLSASDASVYKESGWVGRFLEARHVDYPSVLPADPFAIELGRSLGRAMMGRKSALGMSLSDTSFIPRFPSANAAERTKSELEQEFIWQMMRQSNVFLQSIVRVNEQQRTNRVAYPTTEWAKDFATAARLIAGGLQTKVFLINTSLWDFHHRQLADQDQMLRDLSEAIYAFQRDLEAFGVAERVCVMTISEFGRRLETTHGGTDHGAGSCLFLVGTGVNAGILGRDPDCSTTDADGNMLWEYDFRQIYASVLGQWFGASAGEIAASALTHHFQQLPLFKGVQAEGWTAQPEAASILVSEPFPNPASEQVSLAVRSRFSSQASSLPLVVRVTDLSGRVFAREQLSVPQMEWICSFDVRSWPSGTYLIHAEIGETRFVRLVRVIH